MNDFVTFLSLALTPPTIVVAIAVVFIFYKSFQNALSANERTERHWLIAGVFIGFFGGVFDNAYWGIAWAADYLDHPSRDFWFANGVFSNLPFRQIATLAAAYCHIRAAVDSNSRFFRGVLALSWGLGILTAVVLV